ncbi:phosphodiester glycosidase family protein [Anaerotalea alkaliphila]|uniref:Phosphodiester glycosidase domain-containing protein n=1 Tax=Anaerotalea alkaliphila TaxID=2662126 RepID=A0A7X5HTY7_9FIRM|nr:phosphodiester glycosidase family protein [Anaerotalea alkaliphila]NDL66505.1 hypothetical protein [Anaerotalea alkaliphila]
MECKDQKDRKPWKAWSLRMAAALVAGSLALAAGAVPAQATNPLLHQTRENQRLSSGVWYETNSKLTKDGWVDIHVMVMDRRDPYTELEILRSEGVFGDRQTLTELGKTVPNLVSSVNASFFNTAINPTLIEGNEIEGGSPTVLEHNYNTSKQGAASLVLADGKALVDYLGVQLKVLTSDNKELYVTAVNKFNNLANPFIITRKALSTTAGLETGMRAFKVVVVDGAVTSVVGPGQPAVVPETGYLIVLQESIAQYHLGNFTVGTGVELQVRNTLDLDRIEFAVSGGGKVLQAGVPVVQGLSMEAAKRHPRTAIGISKDNTKIILMVVDGRGSSIGATHGELASYLLEYGAYEAMVLDGGGSSTMTGKLQGQTANTLLNSPSGLTQRKVVNGVGFVSTAPKGTLQTLVLKPEAEKSFKNSKIGFTLYGLDQYHNLVQVQPSQATFRTEGGTGNFQGNTFQPTSAGEITLVAEVQGVRGEAKVQSLEGYIGLEITPSVLNLNQGQVASFSVHGTDVDGHQGAVNPANLTWTLDNPSIGEFKDGTFHATDGSGYSKVTATANGITLTAYITVGGDKVSVQNFERFFKGTVVYPDTVGAIASISTEQSRDSGQSVKLEYNFRSSDVTQAAYAEFTGWTYSIPINGFGIWVYGDGSGNLLRARVADGDGKIHNIPLSTALDFTGWRYLEGAMPTDMAYPVQIERLYVASLSAPVEYGSRIYLDSPVIVKGVDASGFETQSRSGLRDPLMAQEPWAESFRLSVFGPTAFQNRLLDTVVMDKVYAAMGGAGQQVFAGKSAVDKTKAGPNHLAWNNIFTVHDQAAYRLVFLGMDNGSLRTTDHTQLQKLIAALEGAGQKNILVFGNKSLQTGFTDKREGQVLQDILEEFKNRTGKNVFYINGSGYGNGVEIREGVRYMDLNGIWYAVGAGNSLDLEASFKVVDFHFKGDEMRYRIRSVFPKVAP